MSDILLPAADAQARILERAKALDPETIDVSRGFGRCLAEPLVASRTFPPWDNSAMDGYALRSADARGPSRLKVIEAIYAGATPEKTVGPGECARIMTGAPMPRGADAVVMQERTRALPGEGLGEVEIQVAVPPGSNVRQAGEDAREGEVLLPAGTAIGVPEAGVLFAQGRLRVQVPRRPQVAIVSSGNELCALDAWAPGRIPDTNAACLAMAVERAGGVPHLLGIARDTKEETRAKISAALSYDVAITSAGVSVGERDYVRDVFAELGVELDFFGVAIKPGKPVAFGQRGKTLVFGLPGNPTSSMVTFELFVRPALRALLGHRAPLPSPVFGRTAVPLSKPAGLTHYLRVTAEPRDGALWAQPLGTQTSGVLRSAATATHLLQFGQQATRLEPGDPVELLPVHWAVS